MELKIVLASNSPRRREIMESLGFDVEVIAGNVDENIEEEGISPELLVQELALLKGRAIAQKLHNDDSRNYLVVAADTVVVYNNEIFGKPQSRADAERMLKTLSGKKHSVITGMAVWALDSGKGCSVYEKTDVYFKKLSDETIQAYLDTEEYKDKAGGYGIQGKGICLVEKIDGDYYNVVGLPVSKFHEVLYEEHRTNVFHGKNGGLWKKNDERKNTPRNKDSV